MSLADALSLIAIVVSFVTFVITIYEQYMKSAKLQLVLGQDIRLSYGQGFSDLGFWSSVAISNQGAIDAVVLRMSGQLSAGQTWTVPVEWQAFGAFDSSDKNHKESPPAFIFKDWTETLVASSRKATTNWIYFSISPLPLVNGTPARLKPETSYSLQLNVYVPKTHGWPLGRPSEQNKGDRLADTWTGSFLLSTDEISYLESPPCIANDKGWCEDSVIAKLSGASRWLRPESPTASITDRRAINQVPATRRDSA
jgi:hypothetical protein